MQSESLHFFGAVDGGNYCEVVLIKPISDVLATYHQRLFTFIYSLLLTRVTISLAMPIRLRAFIVSDGVIERDHRQRLKGHGRSAPGNRLVAYPLVANERAHTVCISVAI